MFWTKEQLAEKFMPLTQLRNNKYWIFGEWQIERLAHGFKLSKNRYRSFPIFPTYDEVLQFASETIGGNNK